MLRPLLAFQKGILLVKGMLFVVNYSDISEIFLVMGMRRGSKAG